MAEQGNSSLALHLDPAVVSKIITETIRTQVATALAANGKDLVESIVVGALQEKRDSYGHRSDREPTVLEKLLRTEVEAATKEAIKTWVAENKGVFVKAIDASLRKNTRKVADGLVDSLVKAVEHNWLRVAITVQANTRDNG
jgi:hypothetical protein